MKQQRQAVSKTEPMRDQQQEYPLQKHAAGIEWYILH
jgi:hypothetical protein